MTILRRRDHNDGKSLLLLCINQGKYFPEGVSVWEGKVADNTHAHTHTHTRTHTHTHRVNLLGFNLTANIKVSVGYLFDILRHRREAADEGWKRMPIIVKLNKPWKWKEWLLLWEIRIEKGLQLHPQGSWWRITCYHYPTYHTRPVPSLSFVRLSRKSGIPKVWRARWKNVMAVW